MSLHHSSKWQTTIPDTVQDVVYGGLKDGNTSWHIHQNSDCNNTCYDMECRFKDLQGCHIYHVYQIYARIALNLFNKVCESISKQIQYAVNFIQLSRAFHSFRHIQRKYPLRHPVTGNTTYKSCKYRTLDRFITQHTLMEATEAHFFAQEWSSMTQESGSVTHGFNFYHNWNKQLIVTQACNHINI